MEDCKQYDNLMREMESLDIDDETIDALSELTYTAEETGVLQFSVAHEDCRTIIALVRLAERYSSGKVPSHLRM